VPSSRSGEAHDESWPLFLAVTAGSALLSASAPRDTQVKRKQNRVDALLHRAGQLCVAADKRSRCCALDLHPFRDALAAERLYVGLTCRRAHREFGNANGDGSHAQDSRLHDRKLVALGRTASDDARVNGVGTNGGAL
jgi:hypothetical protein